MTGRVGDASHNICCVSQETIGFRQQQSPSWPCKCTFASFHRITSRPQGYELQQSLNIWCVSQQIVGFRRQQSLPSWPCNCTLHLFTGSSAGLRGTSCSSVGRSRRDGEPPVKRPPAPSWRISQCVVARLLLMQVSAALVPAKALDSKVCV